MGTSYPGISPSIPPSFLPNRLPPPPALFPRLASPRALWSATPPSAPSAKHSLPRQTKATLMTVFGRHGWHHLSSQDPNMTIVLQRNKMSPPSRCKTVRFRGPPALAAPWPGALCIFPGGHHDAGTSCGQRRSQSQGCWPGCRGGWDKMGIGEVDEHESCSD